jgi:molecular chaperone GrpE
LSEDKDIIPNDDIAIEFVDHTEEEPVPAAPPARQSEAGKTVQQDETAEKLRLSEEKILRLRADFENYKKRIERDNSEMQARNQMELLRKLLPFLDNMERAFENIPKELIGSCAEGLALSIRDLENGLKSLGLEEVATTGTQFDPSFHESLGFEDDSEKGDNEILKVCERGYMFKGKLLRPAKVFINRPGGGVKKIQEDVEENNNG